MDDKSRRISVLRLFSCPGFFRGSLGGFAPGGCLIVFAGIEDVFGEDVAGGSIGGGDVIVGDQEQYLFAAVG